MNGNMRDWDEFFYLRMLVTKAKIYRLIIQIPIL
jgi:hypothetical protein